MDFFTHLTISLLVSTLLSGSLINVYTFLGIFIGLLPDFDFLLFPLWKKVALSGHHGITHTLGFIILISCLIYALLTLFFGLSDQKLLLLMLLVGSLHILGDFIGTGGVAPFYPFKKGYSSLNLDLGNNPILMTCSFAGFVFLVIAGLGFFNFLDARVASIILGLAYIIYFALRAVLKRFFERVPENRGFVALPTTYPWNWKFARRTDSPKEIEIELKTATEFKSYRIPKDKDHNIISCQDLVYSYWHPQVQAQMRFFRYPCYRIICDGDRKEIIWNSIAGKLTEVHVVVDQGELKVNTDLRKDGRGIIKESR
ncbi:MAG: metal-dependent hydrolase [Methanotrichaceae archaeon]|nr:metal-dependent hydrolase [Methanotrichaceae archaeon]